MEVAMVLAVLISRNGRIQRSWRMWKLQDLESAVIWSEMEMEMETKQTAVGIVIVPDSEQTHENLVKRGIWIQTNR